MNYTDIIQNTLNYIDDHITEKLFAEELAKLAGFSTYHFYRVFRNLVGITIMTYVTRRKLQYALYELSIGGKVLDTALNYGFETHAGFTKAFKKHFGYAPNFYRIHAPISLPQKVDLKKLKENNIGGIIMEPKIMIKESFKIVGYEFKTTLKDNAHSRDIPAFWDKCGTGDTERILYSSQNTVRHGEYGICVNTNPDSEEFSYLLGVEVSDFGNVKQDMFSIQVPSATYAVFTTPAVEDKDFVASIEGTWRYILEDWFPSSNYEIDDSKLDFEFYDERCHPWEYEKVSMDIYVPVIKK
ncbi:effector binding domain-containing protein [Clostridium sp.]|uniref:AraC family transcriptional regulator n=1 Tax=Clostridium sp. TaxID=1506 RepID=UPI002FCC7D51